MKLEGIGGKNIQLYPEHVPFGVCVCIRVYKTHRVKLNVDMYCESLP